MSGSARLLLRPAINCSIRVVALDISTIRFTGTRTFIDPLSLEF
jgi:hypothetical protein